MSVDVVSNQGHAKGHPLLTNDPITGTMVHIMGTIDNTGIGSALFGKTRRALLGLLFTHDGESFYLREIIRALGLGRGAVQRELARLTGAGLIIRTARGNQVFYQANRQSPVFTELKSLMVKTVGVSDVVRDSLESVSGKIKVAFLYGSIVTGTDTAASDIDLVVIGSAGFGDVTEALSAAEDKLGREVNPTVYSVSEFRKKVKEGHHFVTSLRNSPRIIVIGDEDELAGLGWKGLAPRA